MDTNTPVVSHSHTCTNTFPIPNVDVSSNTSTFTSKTTQSTIHSFDSWTQTFNDQRDIGTYINYY